LKSLEITGFWLGLLLSVIFFVRGVVTCTMVREMAKGRGFYMK